MQDLRRDLVSLEGQDLNAFVKEGFITEDRQLFVQNSVLPKHRLAEQAAGLLSTSVR